VEHQDPAQRDYSGGKRYVVQERWDGSAYNFRHYETDDLAEAIRRLLDTRPLPA
jgi:hypothetical protein